MKFLLFLFLMLFSVPICADDIRSLPIDSHSEKQIYCLSEALYFEARNQSDICNIIISNVIFNRTLDKRHPNNFCGVVHARHQFEYYWDGKSDTPHEKNAWVRSKSLANLSVIGYTLGMKDVTDTSLYFHTTNIKPNWNFSVIEKTVTCGNHVFYKDKEKNKNAG
jgi:N-acetylmuramoyl-L-alanine amidase